VEVLFKLVDRTLSCLDGYQVKDWQVNRFAELLLEAGVDCVEVSEKFASMVQLSPDKLSLRLQNPGDYIRHPAFSRFVCLRASSSNPRVITELALNDMKDSYTIAKNAGIENVRLRGLDGCLLEDYLNVFELVRKTFPGVVELCPTNRNRCATAIAVEWAADGGSSVVSSFAGIGGFACTEEVIMALRMSRQRKPGKMYGMFPEMRRLMQDMCKRKFPRSKPVIGEGIFCVESGLHVDGIAKQPKCYEPFPPETVGQERTISLGKGSGKASIEWKLKELGICIDTELAPALLRLVKEAGISLNQPISDKEFKKMALGLKKGLA
jgi:homocitrate synthase NifV